MRVYFVEMWKRIFCLILIIFSTTIGCWAKEPFMQTPERWTIKIRGGREVAEKIAHDGGFTIYHEFKELPGIFTLQKVTKKDEPDVTVSQNVLRDQSEMIFNEATLSLRSQHMEAELKFIRLFTKNLRRLFHRIRKILHIP